MAPCFLSKWTRSGVWPLSVTFFDLTSSVCFCSVNIIFPGFTIGGESGEEPVSSSAAAVGGGGGFLPFFFEPGMKLVNGEPKELHKLYP